jgi:endonuclease-8
MPEGDSIHRLARRLAPLLEGREVLTITARRLLNSTTEAIVGHRIVSVEAKGKNLLIHFDDDRALHIHLRMEGRVSVERPRSPFWAPERYEPDLRLAVKGTTIVGRRLAILRLLTGAQVRREPALAGLGPDLVTEGWDEAEALARLRALRDREIGDALLVQRVAAGIGNIYKSEVLFLAKIDPRTPVASLDDDELRALLRRASALLRKNLGEGPRITRPTLAGPRLWVYGRGGRPCLRCGTTVKKFVQTGRSTYYCPRCQPPRTEGAR